MLKRSKPSSTVWNSNHSRQGRRTIETTAMTTPDTRRIRISGDGTSANTTITDAVTGEKIGPVVRYMITQERHQLATAVVDIIMPQVDIECDAVIQEAPAHTLDEDFDHFLSYSGLHGESDDVKAKIKIGYADQWKPHVFKVRNPAM